MEDYILVEPEELIRAMEKSKKNKILDDLMNLFINSNNITEEGLYKVKKGSKVYNYLIKNPNINLDSLSRSLSISIYECNHEMERYLKKYFRLLIDAKINNEDEKVAIDFISMDKKVVDYIKMHSDFDEYVKTTIKKRLKKVKKEEKTIKNRSYTIM